MAGRKKARRPEFLEGTTTRPMVGPDVDEDTGRKIPVDGGVDLRLPYALAMRLSRMPNPRFVIDPELRKIAKAQARKQTPKGKAENGNGKGKGKGKDAGGDSEG